MRSSTTGLSNLNDSSELFDRVISGLNKLPSKPKRRKRQTTLQEVVDKLYDELQSARDRGRTYDDLAQVFLTEKIQISPGTLRKYMAKVKKNRSQSVTELEVRETDQCVVSDILSSSHTASLPVVAAQSQTNNRRLSPDRQASLTRLITAPDGSLESEFSNLN